MSCFSTLQGVKGGFEDPERWGTWACVDEIYRNSSLFDVLAGDSEAAVSILRLCQLHHKFNRSNLGFHFDPKERALWF
jgi:hypothetical protein